MKGLPPRISWSLLGALAGLAACRGEPKTADKAVLRTAGCYAVAYGAWRDLPASSEPPTAMRPLPEFVMMDTAPLARAYMVTGDARTFTLAPGSQPVQGWVPSASFWRATTDSVWAMLGNVGGLTG